MSGAMDPGGKMSNRVTMRALLVIPSYRDAARLAVFLPDLCEALQAVPDLGIRVVDDGSGAAHASETAQVVRALAQRYPLLLQPLLFDANQGKGAAIYAAWDAAVPEVEWLGFADADGATSAHEVKRLVCAAMDPASRCDAMAGSRVKMMGRTVRRSLKRHIIGRIFATLASVLTGLAVYDSQCGCKMIRRCCYLAVRSQLTESRFGFDMDLLVHLDRSGAKISEFPVDWTDIPGSKVSLLRDGLRMFRSLWRLRG